MNTTDILFIMGRCLLLTIVIEIIISLILGVRNKKDLLMITLINICTNPIVVFIYSKIIKDNLRTIVLLILEIMVVLIEGAFYKKTLKFKRIPPYLLSSILNLCSYLIGTIILIYI